MDSGRETGLPSSSSPILTVCGSEYRMEGPRCHLDLTAKDRCQGEGTEEGAEPRVAGCARGKKTTRSGAGRNHRDTGLEAGRRNVAHRGGTYGTAPGAGAGIEQASAVRCGLPRGTADHRRSRRGPPRAIGGPPQVTSPASERRNGPPRVTAGHSRPPRVTAGHGRTRHRSPTQEPIPASMSSLGRISICGPRRACRAWPFRWPPRPDRRVPSRRRLSSARQ